MARGHDAARSWSWPGVAPVVRLAINSKDAQVRRSRRQPGPVGLRGRASADPHVRGYGSRRKPRVRQDAAHGPAEKELWRRHARRLGSFRSRHRVLSHDRALHAVLDDALPHEEVLTLRCMTRFAEAPPLNSAIPGQQNPVGRAATKATADRVGQHRHEVEDDDLVGNPPPSSRAVEGKKHGRHRGPAMLLLHSPRMDRRTEGAWRTLKREYSATVPLTRGNQRTHPIDRRGCSTPSVGTALPAAALRHRIFWGESRF